MFLRGLLFGLLALEQEIGIGGVAYTWKDGVNVQEVNLLLGCHVCYFAKMYKKVSLIQID